LLSCKTSRQTITDIKKTENNTEQNESQESSTKLESETSIKNFLDEFDVNIIGKGSDYKLVYNGFEFIGNADLSVKKKTQETTYRHWQIYQHYNIYHNYIVTKTIEITKHKETESKANSFWLYVLIGVISFGLGFYTRHKL
jgi:hypothetical protein